MKSLADSLPADDDRPAKDSRSRCRPGECDKGHPLRLFHNKFHHRQRTFQKVDSRRLLLRKRSEQSDKRNHPFGTEKPPRDWPARLGLLHPSTSLPATATVHLSAAVHPARSRKTNEWREIRFHPGARERSVHQQVHPVAIEPHKGNRPCPALAIPLGRCPSMRSSAPQGKRSIPPDNGCHRTEPKR